MSKKVKHPKMDPLLISTKQEYELDWIIRKMKKEGIVVTHESIKETVELVGRNRKKVYASLRGL